MYEHMLFLHADTSIFVMAHPSVSPSLCLPVYLLWSLVIILTVTSHMTCKCGTCSCTVYKALVKLAICTLSLVPRLYGFKGRSLYARRGEPGDEANVCYGPMFMPSSIVCGVHQRIGDSLHCH